ncbi:MAG TPA: hypothetical protein P5169_04845 [Kiritimatiellia bacterium]|jgi:uncharacterized membrane protein required for colicin V production|nr:hypothetical protein [Lentisphaerota bacterium]HRV31014.1 hypothetical protein [Kiritimatiellia bacterium]
METLLTVMGWLAVAALAWFLYDFVRKFFAKRMPRERTENVNKDMY